MDSNDQDLRRALAFTARVDEGAATATREWAYGTALVTPELPKVWDASYFRVERPAEAEDAEQLVAEAVEIAGEAGLAHATIVVESDDDASRIGPQLLRRGFEETRFVLMALRRVPPEPEIAVGSASFDDVAPSRREMTLESFQGDEALADQLRELDRRLEATIGGRWFAIRDGDQVVSRAWLLGADGIGQVEDVATDSARRGKGLARAVVSAAARASAEAGNELTFVIADDGATTPELYRKTGFEPIGLRWRFVQRL